MAHIADIPTTVRRVIAEQLCRSTEEVQPESRLIEDLDADSLDVIELGMALADELGIEIPADDDMVAAHTVQQVIDLCIRIRNTEAA
jgi:acyl carrier protein